MCTAPASAAPDEAKLGIGLEQGYDYPYILEIDPYGLGAAAGMMQGDHIKQIGSVSMWFTDQAEKFFKYHLSKDKPFIVLIERNGALNQIIVDKSKPYRVFPKKPGTDVFSNCYFAPETSCIQSIIETMRPDGSSHSSLLRHYFSKIESFMLLNEKQKAMAVFRDMERLFFNDPTLVEYDSWSVLESRNLLGLAPEKRHFDYIYRHTEKRISALAQKASMFAKFGQAGYADIFYNDTISMIEKKPDELQNKLMFIAPMLAKLGKKQQLLRYLQADNYSSTVRNSLLARYITELVKEQKRGELKDALSMIFSVKRPWTNKDYVLFAKLFHKLHMNDAARNMVERLEKLHEKNNDKPLFQPLTARSLIVVNGALGRIHLARKYIDKHYKDQPLEMLMKLAVEAANSRSSKVLAVQYYKDLPKLIDEAYALLIKLPAAQKKKLNRRVAVDFYEVLAAHQYANPQYSELKAYTHYEDDYKGVIETFIAARRFDEAMTWINAAEQEFGTTYWHGDIYSALGALSPSREFSEKFKKYPSFQNNKIRYYNSHIARLYWNGYFEEALLNFNLLNTAQKVNLTLNQAKFVVPCKMCTI